MHLRKRKLCAFPIKVWDSVLAKNSWNLVIWLTHFEIPACSFLVLLSLLITWTKRKLLEVLTLLPHTRFELVCTSLNVFLNIHHDNQQSRLNLCSQHFWIPEKSDQQTFSLSCLTTVADEYSRSSSREWEDKLKLIIFLFVLPPPALPELDELTMECVLVELESVCEEKMRQAIETEEGLGIEYDEDVVCDVCRSPEGEDGNEMVFCDKCNVCVHQVKI